MLIAIFLHNKINQYKRRESTFGEEVDHCHRSNHCTT